MSTLPGPDREQVPELNPRTRRENERRTKLLDLVQGGTEAQTGEYDSQFFLKPNQVFELFRETRIGELIPDPGVELMGMQIEGVLEDGEFWTPTVGNLPGGALLRRSIENPEPHQLQTQWRRSLGVAFQFNETNRTASRVVTSELTLGVILRGARGMWVYTQGRVLLDGNLFIMQDMQLEQGGVAVIDEFLTNVDNLTKPPIYRQEFEGVDLSGLRPNFGDTITIQ